MLRLNASVHSWLTRQELKQAKAREQQRLQQSSVAAPSEAITDTTTRNDTGTQIMVDTIGVGATELADEEELHRLLKNEVGDMYGIWDEADARFVQEMCVGLVGVCRDRVEDCTL